MALNWSLNGLILGRAVELTSGYSWDQDRHDVPVLEDNMFWKLFISHFLFSKKRGAGTTNPWHSLTSDPPRMMSRTSARVTLMQPSLPVLKHGKNLMNWRGASQTSCCWPIITTKTRCYHWNLKLCIGQHSHFSKSMRTILRPRRKVRTAFNGKKLFSVSVVFSKVSTGFIIIVRHDKNDMCCNNPIS